jgi:ankyrin repeat protein
MTKQLDNRYLNKYDKINENIEELMELIKVGKQSMLINKLKYYSRLENFNINEQNEYGNTLLHTACRVRNYEIVKILLETYNAKVDIKNEDGRTALHIATIYGSTDKVLYMLQNGGTTQITNSSDIINLIVDKYPHSLLIRDKDNMTAMNYFNIHSDINSNRSLNKSYKSYKRNMTFFDSLKNILDVNDYELSISIYCTLKNAL